MNTIDDKMKPYLTMWDNRTEEVLHQFYFVREDKTGKIKLFDIITEEMYDYE